MKTVWILNQYNMPPELGHLNRHYNIAKYLKRMGYNPIVLVGSYLHNTKIQMITDRSFIKKYENADFQFYFIKTHNYSKSRWIRVLTMFEYYFNLFRIHKQLDKPDVIIGSTAHPLAAIAAVRLAKRYRCKSIVEVRDLWPESFVAYGIIKKNNPILKLLYAGEKWIYRSTDKLIFTMEGGIDYLKEHKWNRENGGPIDLNHVYHLNNGVDLEAFYYNEKNLRLQDEDLNNEDIIKIVYSGSIRKVNKLNVLLDAAEKLKHTNIKLLIWGDGDERKDLEARCKARGIENISFKGNVDKKYIPFILNKADINLLHVGNTSILKYGISTNKLFDYIAAEKPILSDLKTNYDLIERLGIGLVTESQEAEKIKEGIEKLLAMDEIEKERMKLNLRKAAKQFDFSHLASELAKIME